MSKIIKVIGIAIAVSAVIVIGGVSYNTYKDWEIQHTVTKNVMTTLESDLEYKSLSKFIDPANVKLEGFKCETMSVEANPSFNQISTKEQSEIMVKARRVLIWSMGQDEYLKYELSGSDGVDNMKKRIHVGFMCNHDYYRLEGDTFTTPAGIDIKLKDLK